MADKQLCLTIAGEAGGEGYKGMYAVACVIQNRAKLDRIGPDKVILSGFMGLYNKMAIRSYKAHKKDIQEIVYSLKRLELKDITSGSTHFDNIQRFGIPNWANRLVYTCTIGHHTFYKEVGYGKSTRTKRNSKQDRRRQ